MILASPLSCSRHPCLQTRPGCPGWVTRPITPVTKSQTLSHAWPKPGHSRGLCTIPKHRETLIVEHKARNSLDTHSHRMIEMYKRCWNLPTILLIQTHTIQHCLSLSDSLQNHRNYTFWSGYAQKDWRYTQGTRGDNMLTQIISSVLWLPTFLSTNPPGFSKPYPQITALEPVQQNFATFSNCLWRSWTHTWLSRNIGYTLAHSGALLVHWPTHMLTGHLRDCLLI